MRDFWMLAGGTESKHPLWEYSILSIPFTLDFWNGSGGHLQLSVCGTVDLAFSPEDKRHLTVQLKKRNGGGVGQAIAWQKWLKGVAMRLYLC